MCLVCAHWNLGKLTKQEADKNLAEMVDNASTEEELMHAQEVIERIQNESTN
jgi:hypothetical protein